MDPKNVDRAGKGFLAIALAALAATAKKNGPKIIEGAGKLIKAVIFRRQDLYRLYLNYALKQ